MGIRQQIIFDLFEAMNGRTADVRCRVLTEDDIRQVLQKEADEQRVAIAKFEQVGCSDAAAKLKSGLTLIEKYLT